MFRHLASASAIGLVLAFAGPAAAQYGSQSSQYENQSRSGFSVQATQDALNRFGYDAGPADGQMGARTRAAIEDFQADNSLPVTGRASPDLYSQLQAALGGGQGTAPASRGGSRYGGYDNRGGYDDRGSASGSSQDLVTDIQSELRQRGYGIDGVSGVMDRQTEDAIRTYQSDAGLPVTGEPSRRLLSDLRNESGGRATTQPGSYSTGRDRDIRRSDADLAADIENALQARGYDVGSVDGNIDAQSRAAIRAYQRDAGLQADGRVSQDLLANIESSNTRAGSGTPGGAAGEVIDRLLNQGGSR